MSFLAKLFTNSDGSIPYLPILLSMVVGALIAIAYVKFARPTFIFMTTAEVLPEKQVKVKEEFKKVKATPPPPPPVPSIYIEEDTEDEEDEEPEEELPVGLDLNALLDE